MSTLDRQNEYNALSELHRRKLSGQAEQAISPAVIHLLEQQHLVDPDPYGDFHINERGEQHLRHLARLGVAPKKVKPAAAFVQRNRRR